MKRIATALAVAVLAATGLSACSTEADTVSHNLSQDADTYRIYRKIVFYNGITDKYVSTVEGYCSIGNDIKPTLLSYTCKVGPDKYIKNFLQPSDNLTWFAIQTVPSTTDPFHFEVVFRPETVIPDVDFQTSGNDSK